MRLDLFDFDLPPELIAQHPPSSGQSRLLYLNGGDGACATWSRGCGRAVPPGDLFVLNDTRVINARLVGEKSTEAGSI
jgi:S-adenosylmethionine:tRNA ribosyltransferase-isomerase